MDCPSMRSLDRPLALIVVGLSLLGAAIADAIASSSAPAAAAAAARSEELIPVLESTATITVVGTVFCDRCHEDRLTKNSQFLSGATVALECKHPKGKRLPLIRIETSTNSRGVFQVQLQDAHSFIKRLRQCKVRLVKSPLKSCRSKTRSSRVLFPALSLKSKQGNNLVYSAGFLSFQTKSLPELCTSSSGGKSVDESTRSIAWQLAANSVKVDQFPSQLIIPTPQLLPPTPGLPWIPPIPVLPDGFPPLPPLMPGAIPMPPIPYLPSAPGIPTSFPSLPPIPFVPGTPGMSNAPPVPDIPGPPLLPPPFLPPGVSTLAVGQRTGVSPSPVKPKATSLP